MNTTHAGETAVAVGDAFASGFATGGIVDEVAATRSALPVESFGPSVGGVVVDDSPANGPVGVGVGAPSTPE